MLVGFSWACFGEAVCNTRKGEGYVQKERERETNNEKELLDLFNKVKVTWCSKHLLSISTTCRQKKKLNLKLNSDFFVEQLYTQQFFPLSPIFTGYFWIKYLPIVK